MGESGSGSIIMDSCLKNAQNNLCVQSVNLKESNIYVRDEIDLPTLSRDETVIQSFRMVARAREIILTNPDSTEDIWDYRFIYSVGIRLIFISEKVQSTDEEYKPILEIIALFEARYLSRSQLKEDDLKAFSTDNVGYHVWPYWREYVQSTCSRIGLSPAFEVPMYIIPTKEED